MTLARDGHLALCPRDEWFESRSLPARRSSPTWRRLPSASASWACRCQPGAALPRGRADTIGPVLDEVAALQRAGAARGPGRGRRCGVARTGPRTSRARHGARRCYDESELLPAFGPVLGKGDAMWRALSVARGDMVVFADSDTANFGAHFVYGLLGPLLCEPAVRFVKATYHRPFTAPDGTVRRRRRPRHRADRQAAVRRSSIRSWPGSASRSPARWPRGATCCARSRSAPATRSRRR